MTTLVRLGAVDDHPVVLRGIAAELSASAPDIDLVAIATEVPALIAAAPSLDVVLLDLTLHDGRDLQANVTDLTGQGATVLVFTAETKPVPILRAVEAGAVGLVLKSDPVDVLADAVRTAHRGDVVVSGPLAATLMSHVDAPRLLSDRQVEILQHIAEGLPRKSIARRLGIAVSTVNEHVNRVAEVFRERGLNSTNTHSLISQARADGYLH